MDDPVIMTVVVICGVVGFGWGSYFFHFLMWKKSDWSKSTKIVLTIFWCIFALIFAYFVLGYFYYLIYDLIHPSHGNNGMVQDLGK